MNRTGGAFSHGPPSPSRPTTSSTASTIVSPKKRSNYHISNLDGNNEIAKKLKHKLQLFVSQQSQAHETQDILYGCLTDMLNNASMTEDKNLQEKQLIEIDKWFDQNVQVVDHRTKVPFYLQSTRASTNLSTPRNGGNQALSTGNTFRNYTTISEKKGNSVFKRVTVNKDLSTSKSVVMNNSFKSPERASG
jgi:hypothetical protein